MTGIDCSIQPTCLAVANCSTRGVCVDWDTCLCDHGWGGESCSKPTCKDLDYCSGHGTCVEYDICECNRGWTGVSCALPDCSGVSDCSGRGECVGPDVCECYSGFRGQNCSLTLNCTELDDCNGQGLCVITPGDGQSNVSCRCFIGFTGANCSDVSCPDVNECSGNGQCVEPNLCSCDAGFTGASCANFSCKAMDFCSGHGECVSYDECRCYESWSGPSCSIANCSGVNDCSSNGVCLLPNTCECTSGYDGLSCDQFSAPNENAPVFTNETFAVSIRENVPIGTKVTTVSADDADTGRNGCITYSISPGSSAEMFLVDSETGEIFTLTTIDYETLTEKTISLVVIARDKGVPSMSASATVAVTVLDMNDNCPTFQDDATTIQRTLRPGQSFNITATDRDSGVNGKVTFSILGEENSRRYSVNESTGTVTFSDGITPGKYTFVIVASDQAVIPCSSRITVTVIVVDSMPEPEPVMSSTGVNAPSFTVTDTSTLFNSAHTSSTSFDASTQLLYPSIPQTSTRHPTFSTPTIPSPGRLTSTPLAPSQVTSKPQQISSTEVQQPVTPSLMPVPGQAACSSPVTVTVTAVDSTCTTIPEPTLLSTTTDGDPSGITASQTTITSTPQPTAATSPANTVEQPDQSVTTTTTTFLLRNVGIEMILDMVWDEDLASPTSEKHRRLSSDISTALQHATIEIVFMLREGSTVADLQLLHNGGEGFDDVATSMLRQASTNGLQVGGTRVTGLDQKVDQDVPTERSDRTSRVGSNIVFFSDTEVWRRKKAGSRPAAHSGFLGATVASLCNSPPSRAQCETMTVRLAERA
ncbi:protocadherin gamma-A5-like [Branchiostoma floridae]|uniref:Protocadherin gamma-A5-like n=1 Tax=Branchiostoma floridae TaxID=7739 RepID=A0A9J7KYN5_BRAFL|nr:protocadherin gamma-A5-like [Branchiostoma floridae]